MAPTTKELLDDAKGHDMTRLSQTVQANQRLGTVAPIAGVPVDKLKLLDEDEDPFNGNLNNRRVAERISRMPGRKYLNQTLPTHIGDPNKAAADVAKSKKLNPEPEVNEDGTEASNLASLRPPTAGSPAAKKAAEAAKAADAAKAAQVAQAGQVAKPAAAEVKPPVYQPPKAS